MYTHVSQPHCFIILIIVFLILYDINNDVPFIGCGCSTSSPLWKFRYANDKDYSLRWCDICIVHEVRPSPRWLNTVLSIYRLFFFLLICTFTLSLYTVFWVHYFHCLVFCTRWLAMVCFSSFCRKLTPRPRPL